MNDKTEVIKASAAIQIENGITLLQRRAWNLLLANAYDELSSQEKHTVEVAELTRALGYTSRNDAHLKRLLKELVSTVLEWNLVGKDRAQIWGAAALLAEVEIENGICTYAFGPTLRHRLYNPKVYARISLSLQSKFDSKHALALWELCLDYLDTTKNYGETPLIGLENYRRLMGISEDMYPQFKEFNRRVIKDPIDEINKKTDFSLAVEYRRKKRKIDAVKFRVRHVLPVPQHGTSQSVLFPDDGLPDIVRELMKLGLSEHDAGDIWQKQFDCVNVDRRPKDIPFDTYVREKIHLLNQQDRGKVRNKTGFLLTAIKQNYANPSFEISQRKEIKSDALASKREMEFRKERLEREYEEKKAAICREIVKEEKMLFQQTLDEVLHMSRFNRTMYDDTRSPIQNYSASPSLASLIDERLFQAYPERFKLVEESYRSKIHDLNVKIESLN